MRAPPAENAAPADWLVEQWGDFGELVPRGFEACVRVFHPARLDGEPVTWAEIAAANGTVPHARMRLEALTGMASMYDTQANVFDVPPADGSAPPEEVVRLLVELLGRDREPSAACFFAIWDGYGQLSDGVRAAPVFELPGRRYHLLCGRPADALTSNVGPNLWWPTGRRWLVASEIDLNTTFVATSRAVAAKILSQPALEAYEVSTETGFDHRGDDVNPLPR